MSRPLRLAILMSLAVVATGAHGAHRDRIVRHRIGAWQLTVDTDSFSGRTTCNLTARHLRYERDTLLVQLPRRVDTMNAVYRIDGGPPITAATDEPRLAQMGFALRLDNLDNPSGARVRIPMDRIGAATRLQIEALPRHRVWTYMLKDLGPAIERAKSTGCR